MIGNPEVKPPKVCSHCRADLMSCQVKSGLGGRRCCADCGHDDVRRDGDGVDRHDHDAEDLLDHDDVQHGLRDEDHHDLDVVLHDHDVVDHRDHDEAER